MRERVTRRIPVRCFSPRLCSSLCPVRACTGTARPRCISIQIPISSIIITIISRIIINIINSSVNLSRVLSLLAYITSTIHNKRWLLRIIVDKKTPNWGRAGFIIFADTGIV